MMSYRPPVYRTCHLGFAVRLSIRMPPSARKLAVALAGRLDAVVPSRLRVRADGTSVNVYDGGEVWHGSAASEILEDDADRTVAERAASATSAVISGVQDAVAKALREQWPALPTGGMALPHTRTDGENVYLWYGRDEDHPFLVLAPIVIADVET